MRIRPVRSEAEYDAAVARIEQLMDAKPDTVDGDELDVLGTLVDAYEREHFPIRTPDAATIIRFQMEQQRVTRKDLEPMIGSRARVSEVLNGKRALTLPMIRRLHSGLNIPIDLLVGTDHSSRPAKRKGRKATQRILASPASGPARAESR